MNLNDINRLLDTPAAWALLSFIRHENVALHLDLDDVHWYRATDLSIILGCSPWFIRRAVVQLPSDCKKQVEIGGRHYIFVTEQVILQFVMHLPHRRSTRLSSWILQNRHIILSDQNYQQECERLVDELHRMMTLEISA